jgi:hypothetical protein
MPNISAFIAQPYSASSMGPSCEVFTAYSPKIPASEEKLKVHSAKVNCYIINK